MQVTLKEMDEDDDVHLCIRCRQSFVGLENYVSHRRQNCCSKISQTSIHSSSEPQITHANKNNIQSDICGTDNDIRPDTHQPKNDVSLISDKIRWETELSKQCDSVSVSNSLLSHPNETFHSAKPLNKADQNQIANDHFTRLYDPIFNNDASVSSFLRTFDNFAENNKITNIPEQSMFQSKDSGSQFDLEPQGFEQRYSDFYGPLATQSSHDLDQPTTSTSSRIKIQDSNSIAVPTGIEKEETQQELDNENVEEPSRSKDILKQYDFMSSLELSSVKLLHEKRKYDDDDDEDEDDDEDDNRPPSHHTGGKWRPGMQPPTDVSGKWRPFSPTSNFDRAVLDDEVESGTLCNNVNSSICNRRPHIFTKGKWLPGKEPTDKMKGSLVHQCDPCNAEFATKASYTRHLNSKIHLGIASVLDYSEYDKKMPRPIRAKKVKAKSFLKTTIANLKKKKPCAVISHKNELTLPNSIDAANINCVNVSFNDSSHNEELDYKVIETSVKKQDSKIPQVKISATKMKCPICRLSFNKAYLAKHFASLAHVHNELENRQNGSVKSQNERNLIILNNMDTLIGNCQLYCEPCKFYCNTQKDFLHHLKDHKLGNLTEPSCSITFICSACPDEHNMNQSEMLHHLLTPAHLSASRDKILSAGKVIISIKHSFICRICGKCFRYYRQYEDHRKKQHGQKDFKLSSRTPRLCPMCSFRDNSCLKVRDHIRKSHDITPHYSCFLCGTMHKTSDEAKKHRHSREHRLKAGREEGGSRHCRFCYDNFDSLEILDDHIQSQHKALCMPCMKCGIIFTSSAAHKSHVKNCLNEVAKHGLTENVHMCELCTFSNPLLAHVFVHTTTIHGEHQENQYSCHLCQVCFSIYSTCKILLMLKI